MAFRVLYACILAAAWDSPFAMAGQDRGDVRAFLPPSARVHQEMKVDLEHDGVAETVLVYTAADRPDRAYETAGIQILKQTSSSSWTVVFDDHETAMAGQDILSVEKLRSASGKDALLVIVAHSGAGTATFWSLIASTHHRIGRLDPARERARILNSRGYADNGYNGVKAEGDRIIEDLSGYTRHEARCCPNRPSLEMTFRFTGDTIAVESVRELPYGAPKSGWHGPLLRLSAKGFWAYGYQLEDGFLVLAGSESPKQAAASISAAIADLRKSLIDQGVLADSGGGRLTLMEDHKFPSLDDAASVMLARPADGMREWKDESGHPVRAGVRPPPSR